MEYEVLVLRQFIIAKYPNRSNSGNNLESDKLYIYNTILIAGMDTISYFFVLRQICHNEYLIFIHLGCTTKPCAFGTCVEVGKGDFMCTCNKGWTGQRCDKPTGE